MTTYNHIDEKSGLSLHRGERPMTRGDKVILLLCLLFVASLFAAGFIAVGMVIQQSINN